MKSSLYFFLVLTVALTSRASQDRAMPWNAVTLEFGFNIGGDPTAKGTVHIANPGQTITELTVNWNDTKFDVPSTEFSIVPQPQLQTLKVLYGSFYGGVHDNAAYLIVELRFGQPTLGEYPRAQFLFSSGRYQDLRITTRTSETTWEDTVKLPGEVAKRGGTTTLLLPDTTQAVTPSKETPEKVSK